MADATIDKLVIDISSDASKAVTSINKLADSLDRLSSRTTTTVTRLNRICESVRSLKTAAAGINLTQLQKLNNIKVSASLSNNLTTLSQALRAIPADSAVKLTNVGRALTSISTANISTTAKSLNQLVNALSKLRSSGSAVSQLTQVSSALSHFSGPTSGGAGSVAQLASALARLDKVGKSSARLTEIANAVNRLKQSTVGLNLKPLTDLSKVKISATIGNNLLRITNAVKAFGPNDANTLKQISSALSSLSSLKGLSLGSAVTQLGKLPAVLREFQNTNMSSLIQQVQVLNRNLGPLARNVNLLAASLQKLPRSMRTQAAAARTVASTNKSMAASFYSGSTNSVRFIAQCSALTGGLFMLSRAFGYCINEANTYIENMNLFNASMGQYAEAASQYAQKVQELMGIDAGEWMRNQGVFQTLATGMGVAADKASVMSQQLTQLGYDIASFYNMDVGTAMEKIQSGIAGELEPLRRIGWDLSEARMQLELTRLGIDQNVSSMTQASKVALRYRLIMSQVTQVHGDMARTIQSPANQLRVLKSQLTMAARAIGNLLIPALNAILPFAIAAAKAIRFLAIEIASFFGIDVNFEVDYSGLDTSGIDPGGFDVPEEDIGSIDDTAGALDDVGDSADTAEKKVEELKRSVMGFDELNKLVKETDDDLGDIGDTGSGGGGGGGIGDIGGGGGDFDMPTQTYDFLNGLMDGIGALTDELARRMIDAFKKVAPIVAGIGSALAAWKLAEALGPALLKLRDKLKDIRKQIDDTNKKKIAPKMALPSPGGFFNNLLTPLNQALGLAQTLGRALATNVPQGAAIGAAGVGIIVTHLTNLMLNSDNFQRFVKMALDYFGQFSGPLDLIKSLLQPIGDIIKGIVDRVVEWAGQVGNLIIEIFKAFGIDISPLVNAFTDFIGWLGSMFGPAIENIFGFIEFLMVDVFEIQWTDALMIAGAGILALMGPAGQVVAAIMLIVEALTLVARAVGWANSPIVEMSDSLDGVSQKTREAFGTALDSYNDLMLQMDLLDFGEAVVSEEDVANISSKAEDIKNTILNNLDAQRNQELANIKLAGYTEEELAKMEANINQHYDNQAQVAESGYARITEIVTNAKNENRALTDEESQELTQIRQAMYDQLAASSGASEQELTTIANNVKNNEIAAATEAASTVIKSAKEKYDAEIAKAEEFIRSNDQTLQRMLDNGEITREEYDRLKERAQVTYDEMKNSAQTNYDQIVQKTKDSMGEQANTINWETGEIKTKWEQFCENVSGKWNEMCQQLTDWYNRNLKPTFDALSETARRVGEEVGRFLSDPVGFIKQAWEGLCGWFQSVVIDPIIGAFRGLANGLIGGINSVIGGVNSLSFTVPDWVPGIGGKHFGFNIPKIPSFAQGGFIRAGQLFMAREAGPELVGTMGSKNAIANNKQIVEGIEQGVFNAMVQVMMMDSANSNERETIIEIPLRVGNEELARAVYKGNATLIRRGEIVPQFL